MNADKALTCTPSDGWRIVKVNSDNLDSAIELVQSDYADGLFLSTGLGFRSQDFARVCSVPKLKGLWIVVTDNLDWTVLEKREDLLFLDLRHTRSSIDLSRHSNLVSLGLLWDSACRLPVNPLSIRRLNLWGYQPEPTNLTSLAKFENLEYLESVQNGIQTLHGIEALQKLQAVCFHYERKLEYIHQIALTNVEVLIMDHCAKVKDIESLGRFESLKEWHLTNSGKIQSLSFLQSIQSLELFTFVGTRVLDGNLEPLCRLRYSGFNDMKHYTHKFVKIREIQQGSQKEHSGKNVSDK